MRIRLLNDGGYAGMERVKFPVEVEAEAEVAEGGSVVVPESEMHRIGCADYFDDPDGPFWPFYGDSWEAV
jgi:hypothetical protein